MKTVGVIFPLFAILIAGFSAAQTPPFTKLSSTWQGNGEYEHKSKSSRTLNSVYVNLREDKSGEIRFTGQRTFTFEGPWRFDNVTKTITLKFMHKEFSGEAKVFLEGKIVRRVEASGFEDKELFKIVFKCFIKDSPGRDRDDWNDRDDREDRDKLPKSFNFSEKGKGKVKLQGREDDPIERVIAVLESNGTFTMTINAKRIYLLRGKWSYDNSRRIKLKIESINGSKDGEGSGKIGLTRDQKFNNVELDAKLNKNKFSVDFEK